MKNLMGKVLQIGTLIAVTLVLLTIPYGLVVGMDGEALICLFGKTLFNSFVNSGLYVTYRCIIDDVE